jgi:hypothetical protein
LVKVVEKVAPVAVVMPRARAGVVVSQMMSGCPSRSTSPVIAVPVPVEMVALLAGHPLPAGAAAGGVPCSAVVGAPGMVEPGVVELGLVEVTVVVLDVGAGEGASA